MPCQLIASYPGDFTFLTGILLINSVIGIMLSVSIANFIFEKKSIIGSIFYSIQNITKILMFVLFLMLFLFFKQKTAYEIPKRDWSSDALPILLPYALCFAAGAMIFVVVEELIPESQSNHANIDIVTMATMVGFTVMMILDVALG